MKIASLISLTLIAAALSGCANTVDNFQSGCVRKYDGVISAGVMMGAGASFSGKMNAVCGLDPDKFNDALAKAMAAGLVE